MSTLRRSFAVLAPLFLTTLSPYALAQQAPGFAINRFDPSERGSEWFALESLDLRGEARLAFGVRIEGSFAGFVGVCTAFSLMTASFGLLIAMLGKTPEATRGISILVTLLLVMLGGSWVPAFLFPQWLQKATFAIPTRWAVDGLDAMVWRGLDFHAALPPIGALLAFAALFGAVAIWRFRWETEG